MTDKGWRVIFETAVTERQTIIHWMILQKHIQSQENKKEKMGQGSK